MTLREWRESKGLTREDVASDPRIAVDPMTVWRWEQPRGATQKRIPAPGYMNAIHLMTRGAVSPNDFYDLTPLDQLDLPIGDAAEAPLFDTVAS